MSSITLDERSQLGTLAHFLRSATDRQTAPEDALAEAFGKTFYPADIRVRWLPSVREGVIAENGLWRAPRRGRLSGIPALDIPQMQNWTEGNPLGDYQFERASSADMEGIRIVKRSDNEIERQELEVIFCRVSSPLPVNRIEDFRRNITNFTILFQAFTSLKAARLAPTPRTNHEDSSSYLIAAGSDITRFMSYPGTEGLIEQEIELALHEIFGLGWDIQSSSTEDGTESLKDFAARIGEAQVSPKLKRLHSILEGALNIKPAGDDEKSGVSELDALAAVALWTYLHTHLRLWNAGKIVEDETSIQLSIRQACYELPSILRRNLPGEGENFQTSQLSSWLRIWFCTELWQAIDSEAKRKLDDIPARERKRLYCDLAYVVRESLRGMLYGERSEFRFQPVNLSTALQTLVEQHAVWVLELPQELELWGILREIGSISIGGGPFYAAGHLQHVLEMYICGAWFCSIKIHDRDGDVKGPFHGYSICEILAGGGAWRPAEGKQIELQRAFGLAVLLHDIGVLLFPFWPQRAEDLAKVDGAARKRLKAIRGAMNHSVEQILSMCERELIESGIFDPAKETKIHEWIEECCEAGQADHSLLGAWYMVRVARSAPRLLSSVVRQAARAILFHGINTQEIRTNEDPAAALLVLCDELIVWRQNHEPPPPREPGRYIYSFAGELRPEESIFLELGMPGLRGTLKECGEKRLTRLSFTLKCATNAAPGKTWPLLKAKLRQPGRLPTPIYKQWLLTSQNLGRIVPLPESELSERKFGPSLQMILPPPSGHSLPIREVFAQVVLRAGLNLRPCLQRWLAQYPVAAPDSEESVTCGPARPFCERRMAPLLQELERLFETIVQEEILRNQAPPRSASEAQGDSRVSGPTTRVEGAI
jgi:hypothetical protein